MYPSILSRHMFKILYNVMIRLIKYEWFSTNDDKYLKLVDCMRGATFKVFNHSTLFSSKSTMVRLPNILAHHQSARKGCYRKKQIIQG